MKIIYNEVISYDYDWCTVASKSDKWKFLKKRKYFFFFRSGERLRMVMRIL